MKTATALLLICLLPFVFLLAQTPATSVTLNGPTIASPGQNITLSVNLAGSAGQSVSAIQPIVTMPAGVSGVTASVGAASTAASKVLTCNNSAAASNCILDALNQTAYADGVVETISLTLPKTPGAYSFTLTSNAASSAGKGVSLAAPAPFSVLVPTLCDVNGDGIVNQADLTVFNSALTGGSAPASFDINGDGVVNSIDAQRIANAGLSGGSCVTGP